MSKSNTGRNLIVMFLLRPARFTRKHSGIEFMRGSLKPYSLDSTACPRICILFLQSRVALHKTAWAALISSLPSASGEKGQTERKRSHRCALCSLLLGHHFERKFRTKGETVRVRGDAAACLAICCVTTWLLSSRGAGNSSMKRKHSLGALAALPSLC